MLLNPLLALSSAEEHVNPLMALKRRQEAATFVIVTRY